MPWLTSDDWDGQSYRLLVSCVPNSSNWQSVFFGALYELTRVWNWEQGPGQAITPEQAASTGLEVFMSTGSCDFREIADAIERLSVSLALRFECACPEGTGSEAEEQSGSEPPVGPGTPWPDKAAYLDDKCIIANVMWEQFREVVRLLASHNVDSLFSGGVSLAVGIVATMLVATAATAGIALVVGVVSGIIALLSSQAAFSFSDMLASMDANKTDIVCALYNAPDADTAKTDFVAAIDDGTLSAIEQQVLSLMAVNQFFNQLFTIPANVLSITPANPIDCATACVTPCVLGFTGAGGFTNPLGSGDLSLSGVQRTLTATERPEAPGQYGVVFSIDGINVDLGADCSNITSGCQTFMMRVLSYTAQPSWGVSGAADYKYCQGGVLQDHPWVNGPPLGQWFQYTYWKAIKTDGPFSMEVELAT